MLWLTGKKLIISARTCVMQARHTIIVFDLITDSLLDLLRKSNRLVSRLELQESGNSPTSV